MLYRLSQRSHRHPTAALRLRRQYSTLAAWGGGLEAPQPRRPLPRRSAPQRSSRACDSSIRERRPADDPLHRATGSRCGPSGPARDASAQRRRRRVGRRACWPRWCGSPGVRSGPPGGATRPDGGGGQSRSSTRTLLKVGGGASGLAAVVLKSHCSRSLRAAPTHASGQNPHSHTCAHTHARAHAHAHTG